MAWMCSHGHESLKDLFCDSKREGKKVSFGVNPEKMMLLGKAVLLRSLCLSFLYYQLEYVFSFHPIKLIKYNHLENSIGK